MNRNSPAFVRAVLAFLADYQRVVLYDLRAEGIPLTSSMQALCECIPRYELPSVAVLRRVADFALTDLYWRERGGHVLTQEEHDVRAAASRLADMLDLTRNSVKERYI